MLCVQIDCVPFIFVLYRQFLLNLTWKKRCIRGSVPRAMVLSTFFQIRKIEWLSCIDNDRVQIAKLCFCATHYFDTLYIPCLRYWFNLVWKRIKGNQLFWVTELMNFLKMIRINIANIRFHISYCYQCIREYWKYIYCSIKLVYILVYIYKKRRYAYRIYCPIRHMRNSETTRMFPSHMMCTHGAHWFYWNRKYIVARALAAFMMGKQYALFLFEKYARESFILI